MFSTDGDATTPFEKTYSNQGRKCSNHVTTEAEDKSLIIMSKMNRKQQLWKFKCSSMKIAINRYQ